MISFTVHPHVRGADSRTHRISRPFSVHPHMRGADVRQPHDPLPAVRFIPTCVGQMTAQSGIINRTDRFIPTCVGQIQCDGLAVLIETRFIPTCVGQIRSGTPDLTPCAGSSPHAWDKWWSVPPRRPSPSVHPYMRGADYFASPSGTSSCGSSPHMRGRYRRRRNRRA